MSAPRGPVVVSVVTIRGMIAVHSVRAVFTALAGVEGIASADVELGRATVEHDGRATPERLREAIAVAGYEVEEVVEERKRRLPLL
ncbi:MAG TPA: heavy-metal-associated domain-containing protein [Gemmatimonadaceae bacterium]|nr:heavy-metal-associated domain-containing protein [Gemmatimonadaceae bacterium]